MNEDPRLDNHAAGASDAIPPQAGAPGAVSDMPQPQGRPLFVPAPAPTPPRQPGRGYLVGIAIVAALCLVVVVSIVSCTSIANTSMGMLGMTDTSTQAVDDGRPKVGVISIDGSIQYDGTACSPSGLRSLLDQAERRNDIKAVVLRVNSGGGVATAGEEMAHYVKEFDKPIVVSSAATNASAAYEISSQADYIYTAKTTAIGAIGVALQVTDLSGLYEKLGINVESITSAESKDSSYGNRPLTDEERAWYQRLVDQIDADFVETVADGRNMGVDEVRVLANGMTFTGADAVENGLADEVGYLEDAVARASRNAGYSDSLDTTTLSLSQPSNLLTLLDVLGQTNSADDEALSALAQKLEALQTR